MTTADLLIDCLEANLATGVAILAVLALRSPIRRAFGARLAYALWLVPPAAAAGSLWGLSSPGGAGALTAAANAGLDWLAPPGRAGALAALWLAGLAANMGLALWRQGQFAAIERAGRAGPAVVGVLQPRLVVPADFTERFSAEERRLIRAHELAHIDRRDSRVNALAVASVWVCWFNPLAHLALHAFRGDQEMACDATVMEQLPGARRAYAETLVRAQPLAGRAVFGCHWRALEPPLVTRLAMLARPPSQARRDLGLAMLAAVLAVGVVGAWTSASAPAQRLYTTPTAILMELSPPDAQEIARLFQR